MQNNRNAIDQQNRPNITLPPAYIAIDMSAGDVRRFEFRDSVETALSDIILLGTEEQVRLAAAAAPELAAGRPVQGHRDGNDGRRGSRKPLTRDQGPMAADRPNR